MFGLFLKKYLILPCIIFKKWGSNMTQFTAVASEVLWVKRKPVKLPTGACIISSTVLFPVAALQPFPD